MRRQTPALTSSSLRLLLDSLTAAKSLRHIAQLHQQLIATGIAVTPFFATKLLQLYADADDLPTALRLFSYLHTPSVFAWTPILALLSRSGHHRRCIAAYVSMRSAAVPPDGYVFPIVLRSAAASPHQHHSGAAFHADAVKFAADSVLQVANALIDAYSKAGDVAAARRVFDFITDGRDLLSWNTIIAAYASTGSADSSLELLYAMRSDGWEPDLVTWNTVMDGFCRAGRFDEAREILDRLEEPSVVSWTTVISGYSRSGNHEAALEVFSRMMREGNVPPDHETLSCVVSSCRHEVSFGTARAAHAYGIKTSDSDAFYCSAGAALVTLYATWNRMLTAKLVFEMMDPADVVTWNAVILGFAHSGLVDAALEYFGCMLSRGIGVDQTTVSTMLPLCSLKLGKEIHGHVLRHYHKVATNLVWNALVTMYSRSGCIEIAHQVFLSMDAPDLVSWNTMIAAYGSHGLGKHALDLASSMIRLGTKPDAVTFTSVLMACSHCGLVDEGIDYFDTWIRQFNFTPTMEQYVCVVDLLARAGRFEEAVAFIRKMPVGPAAAVWGSLLSASRTHQNVEFGQLAFEELVRLEPENPGIYVTMSNIYVRVGKWQDAKKVRMMMESEALLKASGCSWTDHNK